MPRQPGERHHAHGRATALIIAALLASAPHTALADVLEIGPRGAMWVAGGPAADPAETVAGLVSAEVPVVELVAGAQVPVTHAPESAGPVAWRGRVAELSAKYDLSPTLIEALVWQESRWQPQAVSPAGARGLAQLMPGTARGLGVNPDDPHANLEGGARYLRQQLDTFGGDLEKALAAYNAGPGRVQRAGGVPPIRETQQYVTAILGRLAAPMRP